MAATTPDAQPKRRGRPVGTTGQRSRARDRAIAQAEITPLEVMLKTMAEIWNAAIAQEDPMERAKGQMAAVSVAKDVAPYLHPRLQATTLKGDKENPLQLDLFDADALKAAVRGEAPK